MRGQQAEVGELAKAELEKAIVAVKRVHAASHPLTLTAMRDLGQVYHGQKRLAKAETLLQRVRTSFVERFDERHFRTKQATRALCDVLLDRAAALETAGNFKEAEDKLNRGIAYLGEEAPPEWTARLAALYESWHVAEPLPATT